MEGDAYVEEISLEKRALVLLRPSAKSPDKFLSWTIGSESHIKLELDGPGKIEKIHAIIYYADGCFYVSKGTFWLNTDVIGPSVAFCRLPTAGAVKIDFGGGFFFWWTNLAVSQYTSGDLGKFASRNHIYSAKSTQQEPTNVSQKSCIASDALMVINSE